MALNLPSHDHLNLGRFYAPPSLYRRLHFVATSEACLTSRPRQIISKQRESSFFQPYFSEILIQLEIHLFKDGATLLDIKMEDWMQYAVPPVIRSPHL